MNLARSLVTNDRTGLLGLGAGLLGDLPAVAIFSYFVLRLLVPIGLIIFASRGVTPTQRSALVRSYLTGEFTSDRRSPRR